MPCVPVCQYYTLFRHRCQQSILSLIGFYRAAGERPTLPRYKMLRSISRHNSIAEAMVALQPRSLTCRFRWSSAKLAVAKPLSLVPDRRPLRCSCATGPWAGGLWAGCVVDGNAAYDVHDINQRDTFLDATLMQVRLNLPLPRAAQRANLPISPPSNSCNSWLCTRIWINANICAIIEGRNRIVAAV